MITINLMIIAMPIKISGGRFMKWIDLRSDTVTEPTGRMREAMASAEVGDDVYEDDPTIKELEKLAATLTGKQAALFTPSGTFANQLAIFTHCNRGDEVILPHDCHVVMHEVGAASVIAGVQLRTMPSVHGKMDPDEVKAVIRDENDIHYPATGLVCIENAYSDGCVLDIDHMKSIYSVAKSKNIPVHMDGARLFNAATALKTEAKELLNYTDTAMFCLSKGLCAPAGSMLVGTEDFIKKARKKRKLMGGGMRQIGILGAAGVIALKEMRLRLIEDHENALYMASELEKIPGIEVLKDNLDINMVFFKITDMRLKDRMTEKLFMDNGIKINPEEDGLMRFVCHYYISRNDIDKVIGVINNIRKY